MSKCGKTLHYIQVCEHERFKRTYDSAHGAAAYMCRSTDRVAVLRCLALLILSSRVQASVEDQFIQASSELRSQVPARLVFSQDDLARCLADSSAKRCVLRGGLMLLSSCIPQVNCLE
jgi:hypothetical protein